MKATAHPTLSLTSISYNERLSEETQCFAAIVNFDGVPAFEATNRGHGGCHDFNGLKGQTPEQFRANMDRYKALVRSQVAPDAPPYEFHLKKDELISHLLTEWLIEKDWKKLTRAGLVLVQNGKLLKMKIPGRKPDSLSIDERRALTEKLKDCVILNFMTETEGFATFRRMQG